eukprot:12299964-Alexandrium_andersonii.AAC.1
MASLGVHLIWVEGGVLRGLVGFQEGVHAVQLLQEGQLRALLEVALVVQAVHRARRARVGRGGLRGKALAGL